MPPSFYDALSPPPALFIAPHDPSPSSSSSLPTLAAVLGLVGGLIILSIFAGIWIYIFRGRLYMAKSLAKREERDMQNYLADQANYSDRPSTCSITGDSEKLVDHLQVSLQVSTSKMPTLRPLLLSTDTTSKGQRKELLLPRLYQIQTYRTVSRPMPVIMNRQSFPFGMQKRGLKPLPSVSTFMKVSSSCPASLGQAMVRLHKLNRVINDLSRCPVTM